MEDDDNWGLQAVVRSCGGATAAAAASSSCSCSTSSSSSSSCFSTSLATAGAARWTGPFFGFAPSNPPPVKEEEASARGHHTQLGGLLSEPDDLDPLGELEELFKPFLTKPVSHCEPLPAAVTKEEAGSPPRPLPFSTTSVLAAVAATVGGGNPSSGRRPLAARQQQQPRPRGMCHGVTNSRSKRRKNLVKKVVCQVPADALCSDVWAWRKYGQKPIKGSPFPRGYYRCSSSKGCPARKQVERSRTDPGMFVITYTSEHNHAVPTHRSCLAGSTRHKSPPRPSSSVLAAAPSTSDDAAACSNPSTSSCGKSSVSYSPLSSVEEELLLPVVPEDAVMGPETGGGGGSVGMDDEDGLLVVSGMDMDEMLDGAEECCSGGSCDDDDDDELLLLAAGF